MRFFRQARAVTMLNLRNIPSRLGSSLVIVIGIAGVVAVLLSILALGHGLKVAQTNSGRADRAIVLRAGSGAESTSNLSRDAAATIINAPGVEKSPSGTAIASAEAVVILDLPLARDGSQANIALRGVGGEAGRLRPELRIVEGRMFGRGLHELIASRSAQGQFRGLRVGGHLDIRGEDWTIVGLFESGGDVHESELMADADAVLSTYHHTLFQSVTVQLQSAAALHGFKTYLKQNPMLSVDVRSEPEFFAWQSNGEIRLISALALIVGFIMALGAVFSALNTMYASLSARSVEIATLRAIGFGAGAVVISVFAEAFALAFAGAVIGTFAAWAFFDGVTIAALNPGSFTQLVFRMSLSPLLVFEGIAWAFVIALFGGLFPALRAARMPIAAGLRTLA